MRMTVAMAVACLLGVGIATAHDAQAAIKRDTTIPAQRLGSALKQLASERDVQLVYRSEVVGERRTSGAVGELTFDEALARLLDGTGLTYQYIDTQAITIVPMDSRAGGHDPALGAYNYPAGVWERFRLAQADQGSSSSSGAAPESRERRVTLEEVIVTAQKREERLQDVPISMSVLGGDKLDSSTVDSTTEALSRVPGVSISEIFLGGGAQVPIRGVAAGLAVATGSTPTAYYLDSVPFGMVRNAIGPDPSVYDLERIEVLRGPQGTLYGASALNGVVRILTKDADLNAFEVKARGLTSNTEGGGNNYRGDMAVNVPIVEGKLAARAVVGYQESSGWIDKPGHKDANDAEIGNLRLKIGAQPTEELSIGLSAWYSRADYGSPNIGLDDGTSPSLLDEPISTDYDAYSLIIGYQFAAFSLVSMTSYLDYANESILDVATALGLPLTTLITSETVAQEVNLNSAGDGPWRWSLGGIYRDTEDLLGQELPAVFPSPGQFRDLSESYAVFGELTRAFADGRFEVTAGVRYFEDEVGHREDSRLVVPPGQPFDKISSDDTFDALTPRGVLTWHPSEQTTVYASYSEGFRSGLSQNSTAQTIDPTLPPAEPDTLTNYEVGFRTSGLGGRLNFDTAVYFIDWQDTQQSITVVRTVNGAPQNTAAIVNSESASGLGVDFAITAMPTDGLDFGVTFGWNDLSFDDQVISGGVVLFEKGHRLSYSPEYTAGASADYAFPLGKKGFEARLSASANYTSAQTAVSLAAGTRQSIESDSMLISRASVSIDAPHNWIATLFVDNLNNEEGSPVRDLIPERTVRVRPRTIGLQFEYRY